jgi:hypothetical protein
MGFFVVTAVKTSNLTQLDGDWQSFMQLRLYNVYKKNAVTTCFGSTGHPQVFYMLRKLLSFGYGVCCI